MRNSQEELLKKAFLTEILFIPKTYEIDYAGIVSNQVYIKWLEDLRYEMMRKYYGWENLMNEVVPVIIRTEINYKKSVRLLERVDGRMWISGIRGPKFFLTAEFYSENIIVADAYQIGAFLNEKTGKPTRVPKKMVKLIEEYEENE